MESLKILTIDDNDSIRLSIASYLEDLGHVVFDAESGEAGIVIIENEKPDIVLTDTHMPGLSGIDILNYTKENVPDTPVIVISGAGEIDSVVKALRAGAWDYITKPIEDLNFLSYSIEQVIKRVNLIKENREKSIEIENKNKELSHTIKELQNTQKDLVEAEKMASLGYMVSGVSHEINTPLGICMTSISYLLDETKDIISLNESKEMKLSNFNSYTKSVGDIGRLIDDSLQAINRLITNFKQLSVDQQEGEVKRFSLNDAVSSVIRVVLSVNENIDVDFEITGDDIEVESFPEVINRVFMKLIENTIVHGFKGKKKGKIEVELHRIDDTVKIIYKNNGEQIPDSLISRIFDPFVTESKTAGTGLGLCIVYNLVKFKLHGEVECSNCDNGVCFDILFPLTTTT